MDSDAAAFEITGLGDGLRHAADDEHVLLDDNIAVEFDCRTVPRGAEAPAADAASELHCVITRAIGVIKRKLSKCAFPRYLILYLRYSFIHYQITVGNSQGGLCKLTS